MSSTTAQITYEPQTFDRAVSDLKEGVAYATKAHAEVSDKAMKTAKDIAAFNQATLEAAAQAGQILASGSQDLFRQMTESGQSAFAETLSGVRAMVSAKSVKERLELQANFTRVAATWAVSEGSRFAQAGIALAEQAAAPLTARAVAAAQAMTTLKA